MGERFLDGGANEKTLKTGRNMTSSEPAIVVSEPWEPEKQMCPQMLGPAEVERVKLFNSTVQGEKK